MFLGIEIGGTKLQLGVGPGDSPNLAAMVRLDIDPVRGAAGILEQIEIAGIGLLQKYPIERIGIGFGGPVNTLTGTVTKSHQIGGWENVPLGRWCEETLGRPTRLGNDCDVAALAEAKYGAARGAGSMFYVTVGTGVGGGLVIGGRLHGAGRPAVAEIGHLRPGLHDDRPDMTVESHASGWGIAAAAVARMTGQVSRPLDSLRPTADQPNETVRQRLDHVQQTETEYVADLMQRCGGDADQLTTKMVAQAAAEGNEVAREVLAHACQVLGWGIAQVITLVAPEVVVVGGGVSLIGEQFFFSSLRAEVARYVFPPLRDSYRIAPADLGESVVVHGALALASQAGE
jgi:glucokinase